MPVRRKNPVLAAERPSVTRPSFPSTAERHEPFPGPLSQIIGLCDGRTMYSLERGPSDEFYGSAADCYCLHTKSARAPLARGLYLRSLGRDLTFK